MLKQVCVSVGEITELGFLPRQDAHILLTASETKYCLLRLHWKEKTMGGTTEQLQNALPLCFQRRASPGSCCCFCSYLGNVPSSRLHISVLCTKQELVHIDPSSVQLLLNAKELLMGICEEYVPSPRTFLAVSLYWVVRTPQ